jgi:hypothetical protein
MSAKDLSRSNHIKLTGGDDNWVRGGGGYG